MDCKELMIGDKVLVKVLSQIPDTYAVHTWTAKDYLRDLLQVKPIPLTPEILEKNGFEFVNDSRIAISSSKLIDNDTSIHFQFYDKNCFFQLLHCGAGSYEIRKFIKYVHELQHALRLCGFEELATNFKV